MGLSEINWVHLVINRVYLIVVTSRAISIVNRSFFNAFGSRPVAPPGFFIEGAKEDGLWGGAPENFFLDHALYFSCKCDQQRSFYGLTLR